MQGATGLRYITAGYYLMEALMVNQFTGRTLDCSGGLGADVADTLTGSLVSASSLQKLVIEQLKEPQPG